MTTPNIILDCDGVLAHWTSAFAKLLRRYGAELAPFPQGEPLCWDWPLAHGATIEQYRLAREWTHQTPGWWYGLPLHPDLEEGLNNASWALSRLCELADPIIVTARPLKARKATQQWVQERLGVPHLPVICTEAPKHKLLAKMTPTVVVEDHPETLVELRKCLGDSCRYLLVDRPYNTTLDFPGLERVGSTGEALSICLGLVKGKMVAA